MFEKTPDIIITPSDLTVFAKCISGCICINPGTICKASTGGTFASITIDPQVIASQGLDFNNNLKDSKMNNRAQERIRVDINNIWTNTLERFSYKKILDDRSSTINFPELVNQIKR